MRLLTLALCGFATAAGAQEKIVGAGTLIGASAPWSINGAADTDRVTVSQHLYLASELGFAANTRIVDVAWRKEYLGATASSGCSVELWLKNVPMTMQSYPAASTIDWSTATTGATKVYSGTGRGLAATTGFVGLYPTADSLQFTYSGGNLEVLDIVDCSGITGDVTTGQVLWRFDSIADKGRGWVGSMTPVGATLLKAERGYSDRRPQTRFHTLGEQPKLYVRAGSFTINSGGMYAPAANYLAVNAMVPNRYTMFNGGQTMLTLQTPAITGVSSNVGVTRTSALAWTLGPGQSAPLEFGVLPTATGAAAWDYSVVSPEGGTVSWGIRGSVALTAADNTNLAYDKGDGTTQNLMTGARLNLGKKIIGEDFEVPFIMSNYGSATTAPVMAQVTGMTNTTVTPSAMPVPITVQTDNIWNTKVRTNAPGIGTVALHIDLGDDPRDVTVEVEGAKPEIQLAYGLGLIDDGTSYELAPLNPLGMTDEVFLLGNDGEGLLHDPAGVVISDLVACEVTVKKQPAPVIAPKGSSAFVLTIKSTATMDYSFKVTIANDDDDENPFDVTFTGKVANAPKLTVQAYAISNALGEKIANGGTHDLTTAASVYQPKILYQLFNGGQAPLHISEITVSDSRVAISPKGPLTLDPQGGEATLEVDISALEKELVGLGKPVSLTLTVKSDDPDSKGVYTWTTIVDDDLVTHSCSAAPGSLVIGALAWLVAARRARRARRVVPEAQA